MTHSFPPRRSSDLSVVVGDIGGQSAIDAIAATFGALPERRAAFDPRTEARVRQYQADRSDRTLIHKGPAEQAELRVYWPARDDGDLPEAMQDRKSTRLNSSH